MSVQTSIVKDSTPVRWVKPGMVLEDGRTVKNVHIDSKVLGVLLGFSNGDFESYNFDAEVVVTNDWNLA